MKYVLALLISIPFANFSYSESLSRESTKLPQAKSLAAVKYESKPFDISINKFPSSYYGHDILAVIKNIKNLPRKAEFEKQEEFDARIAKWKSSIVVGSTAYVDLMAFEISQSLTPDVLIVKYDADAEEFLVKVNFQNLYLDSDRFRWLETFYSSKNLGVHEAMTRMGIKFRVSSFTAASVGIAFNDPIEQIEVQIKAPRDQAISLKSKIRAFAVVRLVEPFKIYEKKTFTASLDRPTEILKEYFGVAAGLESLIIVDGLTGNVLSKTDAPFARCIYDICS